MKRNMFLLALAINISVTNAQTKVSAGNIFREYLESAGAKSPKETASYFAQNGSLELPFNESIGLPYKIVGRDSIAAIIAHVVSGAKNFRLTNIKVIMETNDKALAEYESDAIMANGRRYKQKYLGYAIIKDGKIELHKEYMNTVSLVSAVFPNGLEDLIPKK
ncbi:nuclear transport factor 2 family protein [Dyadobacter sp. LJ53]|uniref:nuclear transport factor 2 family protein n=1 Tax=Dyadobacter chenwenxiniae TaxID=2906456 RepID=UPI001F36E669|nr:nuclear transport factor 2 family protein [Dyadobacter chenwenxiniae]MCF0051658.1 nuclear transport factor 2 family protein [Dyadobacter chenwenxiniae]